MSRNSLQDLEAQSFYATLALDDIYDQTMTDSGERACDLEPIESCTLTPGDTVPLGRDSDGALAYPEFPSRATLEMSRKDAAEIARIFAAAHGITEEPKPPFAKEDPSRLLMVLLEAALPRVFYPDSAHGKLAYKFDVQNVLAGNMDVVGRQSADS